MIKINRCGLLSAANTTPTHPCHKTIMKSYSKVNIWMSKQCYFLHVDFIVLNVPTKIEQMREFEILPSSPYKTKRDIYSLHDEVGG